MVRLEIVVVTPANFQTFILDYNSVTTRWVKKVSLSGLVEELRYSLNLIVGGTNGPFGRVSSISGEDE